MDKAHINDHGNHLLELCKSTGLVIFNGRLGADKGTGEYTRVDTMGCSVIDYFVGSPALFDIVSNFCVKPKFPESDHRPLECFLSSSFISKGHDMNHPSFDKWLPHVKYQWSSAELHTLTKTMCDMQSQGRRSAVIDTLVNKLSTNDVADAFDNYIHQAIDRTFATRITNASVGSQKGPKWYDRELRLKRSAAIKAGENNLQGTGNGDLVTLCREYRSTKQRKQREYKRKCLESIEYAFKYDEHSMWEVLKNIDRDNRIIVEPSDVEFYEYFKSMSSANDLEYFNDNYEQEAKLFLEEYANPSSSNFDSDITKFIINQNFSTDEIKSAIDALKNNKSPGIDAIPAEFVKCCKDILAEDITMILNYVVEERNFPDVWTEGLRSAVFKSGKYNV